MNRTKHKGLRLSLRWQIAQRRRQRKTKANYTPTVGEILPLPDHCWSNVEIQSLSVECDYADCSELIKCRELLGRRLYRLSIKRLTAEPANCENCPIRKLLAVLREPKSHQLQSKE